MDQQRVHNLISDSIKAAASESPSLLIEKVGERALCSRILIHLHDKFDSYFVDAEYNLDLSASTSKMIEYTNEMLQLINEATTDRKERRTVPDIIVHKRDSDSHGNLAVIEVKFADARQKDKKFDILKVKAIKEKYSYTYAITVHLPRSNSGLINIAEIASAIEFH